MRLHITLALAAVLAISAAAETDRSAAFRRLHSDLGPAAPTSYRTSYLVKLRRSQREKLGPAIRNHGMSIRFRDDGSFLSRRSSYVLEGSPAAFEGVRTQLGDAVTSHEQLREVVAEVSFSVFDPIGDIYGSGIRKTYEVDLRGERIGTEIEKLTRVPARYVLDRIKQGGFHVGTKRGYLRKVRWKLRLRGDLDTFADGKADGDYKFAYDGGPLPLF